jgi:outer membrane protein assembly factor BamB
MNRREVLATVPLFVAGCSSVNGDEATTTREHVEPQNCADYMWDWNSFLGDATNGGTLSESGPIADEPPTTVAECDAAIDGVVTAGNRVVCKTATGLCGVDLASGGSSWGVEDEIDEIPALSCGVATYGNGQEVVGLDIETGERRWGRYGGVGVSDALFAPYDDGVVVIEQSTEIVSLAATTGAERWKSVYDLIFSGIAVLNDTVYATVGATGESDEGVVLALDARDGSEQWRNDDIRPIRGTPSAWDETVFVVDDRDTLLALNATDGSVRWRHSLPAVGHPTPVLPRSQPLACLASYETEAVVAVDREDGTERWQRSLGIALGNPVCTGDQLLVHGAEGLHALSLADGSLRWRRPDVDAGSALAITDDGLYFGSGKTLQRIPTK